jgi:hypothetical protein
VQTDAEFTADTWEQMVCKKVKEQEEGWRAKEMAQRSTMKLYRTALTPPVGKMAPYLLNSRNREGAWIRCRLRSDTLPLLPVLYRYCRPTRPEGKAMCPLCMQEAESVVHFVSRCAAPKFCELRMELCRRLQQHIRTLDEDTTSGVKAIDQLVTAVLERSAVLAEETAVDNGLDAQWCELVLGRSCDATSGDHWDAAMLRALSSPIHNYLLLLWRARASLLGGVPTLNARYSGITMVPYRRMKSISVEAVVAAERKHTEKLEIREPVSSEHASGHSRIVGCQTI